MSPMSRISDGSDGLGAVALALAEQSVRSHQDDAITEKALSTAVSKLRQVNLEAGRRALVTAANKAVAGAAVSAGFQLAAAGAQFASASALSQSASLDGVDPAGAKLAEVSAKTWDAVAALDTAFSKAGDIISATGQYDQARKAALDKSAEALQQEVQDAERARSAAKEAQSRELAAMKDLIELQRDAARAAQRA
jgi:hypothetical protein